MCPLPMSQAPRKDWIRPKMRVQRNGAGPVMEVLRLDRRIKKKADGTEIRLVQGVICLFKDRKGKEHQGTFHTRELTPCKD